MKRFVDIRIETIKSVDNLIERVKHNTRFKRDKRVVNELGFVNERGKIINGFNSEYSKNQVNFFKRLYPSIVEKQKQKNKNFRAKKHSSFAEGVLYFSKGINEDYEKNSNDFQARLKTLLHEFEKRNNTKVFNYQIHTDESGNVHVHFIFQNFDNETGKSLNFTRNKANGSWLQDLAYKHFGSFGKGYQRGVKKERTEKHLSIEEYKELQESKKLLSEAQKQLKKAQNELAHTKALLEEKTAKYEKIERMNEDLNRKASETRKELLYLISEMDNIVADFEEFVLEESDKAKLDKLMNLFSRYSKNENKDRMLSSIKKAKRLSKEFKQRYTRKSIR